MSELTPCNYCSLQHLKAKYKGQKVEVKADTSGKPAGWTEGGMPPGYKVFVDGKDIEVWFMAITDHCCC